MSSPVDTTKGQVAETAPTHPGHAEAGAKVSANRRRRRFWVVAGALLLAALGAGAYGYYWWIQPRLPPGFASANGRVEATEYDVATKRAGRALGGAGRRDVTAGGGGGRRCAGHRGAG